VVLARDTKKIDAKGRFFVPAKQKETMGTDLVVTNSLDVGYLCVYTKKHFERIVEQLGKLNSMDPNVRKIKRAIIGEASEVSVDSQGRIAVNAELWERIFAKAGDEICVFNDDGKLDICSKSFYENEDHDLSNIEGLDTKYYVEGL
jgi:MraZ protein